RTPILDKPDELARFIGSGLNQNAERHLITAAYKFASEKNFSLTGTVYYSPVGIEDVLGFGLILRHGAKIIGSYVARNAAKTGMGLADDFLASATKPWGEQGLTVVGRALQKHAGREGSVFQGVKFSHKTANQEGLNILNQIMNSPNKVVQQAKGGG